MSPEEEQQEQGRAKEKVSHRACIIDWQIIGTVKLERRLDAGQGAAVGKESPSFPLLSAPIDENLTAVPAPLGT
jgi:hypothetical protein